MFQLVKVKKLWVRDPSIIVGLEITFNVFLSCILMKWLFLCLKFNIVTKKCATIQFLILEITCAAVFHKVL